MKSIKYTSSYNQIQLIGANKPMNMFSNNNNSNSILVDENDRSHQAQFSNTFNSFYSLAHQPDLNSLVIFIQNCQNQIKNHLQDEIIPPSQQQQHQLARVIQGKCLQIRNKNQFLLTKLLNLREKISRAMASYIVLNSQSNNQYSINTNQIVAKRQEISQKIEKLRRINLPKERRLAEGKDQSSELTNQVILQLKTVTEDLQKTAIKESQELNLVIKQIKGKDAI